MSTAGHEELVVVQCRYGSTRMPGKALAPLAGAPMLAFLLQRLQAGCPTRICVATTRNPDDDAVARCAEEQGVRVVRGETDDVLARYLRCLREMPAKRVVRVTADNPLTLPALVTRVLQELAAGWDYVDAVHATLLGMGVDGFTADTLRRLDAMKLGADEREHINMGVLSRPESFRIRVLTPEGAPGRSEAPVVTVDTEQDYRRVAAIVQRLGKEALHADDHALRAAGR